MITKKNGALLLISSFIYYHNRTIILEIQMLLGKYLFLFKKNQTSENAWEKNIHLIYFFMQLFSPRWPLYFFYMKLASKWVTLVMSLK